MRNPNGYGTIKKLSGKRRRPYGVYITKDITISPTVPSISFLSDVLTKDTYLQVKKEYDAYVSKQTPVGKQSQTCIGYYATRKEAMMALAEFNKKPYNIDDKKITFQQAYESFTQTAFKGMQKGTQRTYDAAYRHFKPLYDMKMIDIRSHHIQAIFDDKINELSLPTLKNLKKVVNVVFKYCIERDVIDKNYVDFVKLKSTKEKHTKIPFTREEIAKLWNYTDKQIVKLIIIHIYTGVRPIELVNIKADDIDMETTVNVRGTKTENAARIVPIRKEIVPFLKMLTENNTYLAHDKNGVSYTTTTYRSDFYDVMNELGFIKHTPHECRHTFISIAQASGINEIILKKIIGHSTGDLTQDTYTHTYVEDAIKEVNKMIFITD